MTITEASTDIWAQSARALTDPLGMLSNAPQLDLTQGVGLFFDVVQRTIDANREFAGIWAELVGSLTAVVREQAGTAAQHRTEDVVADSDGGHRSGVADAIIDDMPTDDAR